MRFAICDDDRAAAAYINDTLKRRYGEKIETSEFYTAEELASYIRGGTIPDCIFMDIVLGDENGIDEVRKLAQYLRDIPVIFFTGFTEYCQDIFIDFTPYGLLTKPIDTEKLYYYTDTIIAVNDKMNFVFSINVGKKHLSLKSSEVTYIESYKRKLIYHTKNGNYEEYIKIDDALDKLIVGFIRCHKSFAVNFRYVKTIDKAMVTLTDGTVINVSRKFSESAKSKFIRLKSQSLGI